MQSNGNIVLIDQVRRDYRYRVVQQAAAVHESHGNDAEGAADSSVRQHDVAILGDYRVPPVLGYAIDAEPEPIPMPEQQNVSRENRYREEQRTEGTDYQVDAQLLFHDVHDPRYDHEDQKERAHHHRCSVQGDLKS